jgi:hypothetical protein
MEDAAKLVPVLSLIVAFLAVLFGPLISLRITRRQIVSSLTVANKQITAPMRQAWINNLRDLLAELTSTALHYSVAGYEERTDEEYRRLTLLEHKVQLMLNAKEEDHRRLESLMRTMVGALGQGKDGDNEFIDSHKAIMPLSRQILKREWDRIKEPLYQV